MTTTMDTTIPQRRHFTFAASQALAMAELAQNNQVAAPDAAGIATVQFLVGPKLVGPVFLQDTAGSGSVRTP